MYGLSGPHYNHGSPLRIKQSTNELHYFPISCHFLASSSYLCINLARHTETICVNHGGLLHYG